DSEVLSSVLRRSKKTQPALSRRPRRFRAVYRFVGHSRSPSKPPVEYLGSIIYVSPKGSRLWWRCRSRKARTYHLWPPPSRSLGYVRSRTTGGRRSASHPRRSGGVPRTILSRPPR